MINIQVKKLYYSLSFKNNYYFYYIKNIDKINNNVLYKVYKGNEIYISNGVSNKKILYRNLKANRAISLGFYNEDQIQSIINNCIIFN